MPAFPPKLTYTGKYKAKDDRAGAGWADVDVNAG